MGGHREDNLNAVLFLENEHCFKNITEYGKLLKRAQQGDLSTKDRKWPDKRVLGENETMKTYQMCTHLGRRMLFTQLQKILHRYMQLWVMEINQLSCSKLFPKNRAVQKKAIADLLNYIDKVISVSYRPDLIIRQPLYVQA